MFPRTWFGWIIFVLGAVVAILLAGIAVLFVALPRAELRGEFERRLERMIGRDVEIAGPLRVTLFPVAGFSAEDVRIANVASGQAPFLARARRVAAGMELLPYVFGGRIVVDRLVLEDPEIHLELDAQGRPNWTLAPTPSPAPRPEPAPERRLKDMSLEEVRISGGLIDYFDARDGDSWRLDEPELRTSVSSLDAPMRLRGGVMFRGERVSLDAAIARARPLLAGQPAAVEGTLESAPVQAEFNGQIAGAGEYFTGRVVARGESARRVAEWFGAPIAPSAGFNAFEVNGELTANNKRVAFRNAALAIDALRGRGDFTLESHQGRPYVSGVLEIEALDLNPYIVPPEQVAAGETPSVEAAEAVVIAAAPDARRPWPTQRIDLSVLKSLDANLELQTDSLRALRLQAGRAHLSVVMMDGFLAGTIHRLDLYGGRGRGRIEIDARETNLRLAQEFNVQNVRALDFLGDAANFTGLEGQADVAINWTGRGENWDGLFSSLSGRGRLAVREGAIRGVDLGGVARTIQRAISGDLINPNARTRFSAASANFAIADGEMATDDFVLDTADLRINTIGVIDLGEQQLNMRIVPREGGIAIPFVVRGAWTGLRYRSDIAGNERRGIENAVRAVQTRAPRAPSG